MLKNKSALTDRVAVASDLNEDELYAILTALVEERKDVQIHKLEVRHKASNGQYRVVARVSKAADTAVSS